MPDRALRGPRGAPVAVAVLLVGVALLVTSAALTVSSLHSPKVASATTIEEPSATPTALHRSSTPSPTTAVHPVRPGSPDAAGTAVATAPPSAIPVSIAVAQAFSALVDPVGALPGGGMMVPDDARRVGWWSAGATVGSASGSTVLVGHVDTARAGLGVFSGLLEVRAGQRVTVTDSAGTVHAYAVSSRQLVVRTALPPSLFATDGPARLVLITCGGTYDRAAHHYEDNVVVVALPVTS